MKGVWTALIALVAAAAYGVASHAVSGAWNFSLAFVIGAVVALALSGFRVRQDTESGDRPTVSPVPSPPQSPDNGVSSGGDGGAAAVRALPSAPTPVTCTSSAPQPQPSTSTPSLRPPTFDLNPEASGETAEALWNRAREMVHNEIPDPVGDAEYLGLVISAAERGHVPALAKLGDYAFRRGAFVEAYFWTTMAKRRLELSEDPDAQWHKEIGNMLLNIRRAWTAAGQPPEFENVYKNFPEERGELGRAFLRLDNRQEVGPTRDYIRSLAEKGNPDAVLFAVSRPVLT